MPGDESGLRGFNPPPFEDRLGTFLSRQGFTHFTDGLDEKRSGQFSIDWWLIEGEKLAGVVVAHCLSNSESPGFQLEAGRAEKDKIIRSTPYITIFGRKIFLTHALYSPKDRTMRIRLIDRYGAKKFLYKTIPELRATLERSAPPTPPALPKNVIRGFLKNLWNRRPQFIR